MVIQIFELSNKLKLNFPVLNVWIKCAFNNIKIKYSQDVKTK
jgi:hypothetical protein